MRSDFIAATFWLVMGVLLSIWAATYSLGSLFSPGPGFIPLILGVLIVLFSLILLGKSRRSETGPSASPGPSSDHWKKVVYTVLTLIAAALVVERIGYLFTIFLMVGFLMRGVEPQGWRATLLTAFFSALGIYVVFDLLLKQPLPRGLLRI
jgi:putative tricarboxylic transport membrane protein